MIPVDELNISSLPQKVFYRGHWSASKHVLGDPALPLSEQSSVNEFTLVSRDDNSGVPRLHHVITRLGKVQIELSRNGPFDISVGKSDWLTPIMSELENSSPLDILTIYSQFESSTARTLLTGHYLATSHKKLFDAWHKSGNSKRKAIENTKNYWKPRIDQAGGVTRLTVQLYTELLNWGESAAPYLLSVLMNTGPRTIHTRLQEARKMNILEKPGSGSRKISQSLYEREFAILPKRHTKKRG